VKVAVVVDPAFVVEVVELLVVVEDVVADGNVVDPVDVVVHGR
jgi:hypothetical protein